MRPPYTAMPRASDIELVRSDFRAFQPDINPQRRLCLTHALPREAALNPRLREFIEVRKSRALGSISRRHQKPNLTRLENVNDLFNWNRIQTVVDSATLRETRTRGFDGRAFYVGRSYRLCGGAPKASDDSNMPRFRGCGEGGRPSVGPGGPPGGDGSEG